MPTFRHGRGTKLIFGGFDLSDQFRDANVAQSADTAETTAFGSLVKTYVIGMTDGRVSASGMFSGGALEEDVALNTLFGQEAAVPLTYAPEGLALGRRVWGLESYEQSYQVSGTVSDLVGISAEWQGTGGVRGGVSVKDIADAVTVTGNDTGADTGVATNTRGGWAVFQVADTTIATSIVLKVQHSTTIGGTYTDLATSAAFTPGGTWGNGKAASVVRVAAGVTVNQFVRAAWVATGAGTAHFHISWHPGY